MSLSGSNFEIDTDANLKVDDPAPSIDWASVDEIRKPDTQSGAQDESFGNGTKEDTAVPSVVDGGIPPNKSDLKFFGVYQEGNTSTGFLNLYWSRVQEPSGTTNMDFEFNQSTVKSSNGLTPVRTAGALLIQYDLAQGGTNPQLFISRWVTTGSKSQCEAANSVPCWGTKDNLTAQGDATGSINTLPIDAADADGLGAHSPRTFGEAQVRMSALIPPGSCAGFASAYLKSRSSDSFTAALKDFVPPAAVNVSNCGRVVVKKVDEGGQPLAGAEFTINPANSATPPVSKLTEVAPGVHCIDNLLLNTQYTIHESKTPPGYDPAADQTFTPTTTSSCGGVGSNTQPDKTFTNVAQKGAIEITKFRKDASTPAADDPQSGVTFDVKNGQGTTVGTGTTGANGKACVDNLGFGSYTVHENVPANYHGEADKTVSVSQKASCAAGDNGTKATVTFHNTPLSSIQVKFTSLAGNNVTKSAIVCKKGSDTLTASPAEQGNPDTATPPDNFDDSDETFTDLEPGLYTCTVDIDP